MRQGGVQREWQLRLSGPVLGVAMNPLASRMNSSVPGKWTVQARATSHTAQVNIVLGLLRAKLAKHGKLGPDTAEKALANVASVDGQGPERSVAVVVQ
jgi:hypothetical protein